MTPMILCLASGLLLGSAVTPLPLGPISLIAFVPLLLAVDTWGNAGASRKNVVAHLYVAFFVYHGITNWWVMSWQEQTDPYLMASGAALWLGHPFFLMLPFYALASIRRRLGREWFLWSIPFAVAGFEWLHGQTDASYPWLTTGYMLIDTPLAQVADHIGVYGVSFLTLLVNTLLTAWLLSRGSTAASTRHLIAAIVVIGIWFGLGTLSVNAARSGPATASVSVALVQSNENPWDKWTDPRKQVQDQRMIVDTASWKGAAPDVVVWSETAIPFTILESPYQPEMKGLQRWVDTSGFTLLTGFADRVIYTPGEAPASARTSEYDPSVRFDHFNAAMTLAPGVGVTGIHRKSMLTPFAERMPFADQLSFAMSWVEWGVGISAWGKGRTRDPLPVYRGRDTAARIGTIICIESIYPEVARDMVLHGADLLCVITNDAWYNGTWGPEQHYAIARMRAIEQRRDLIRCAMSGETGFIRNDGSSLERMPSLTTGSIIGTANTYRGLTAYASIGDVIPPVGFVLTIVILIGARFPLVVRKMRVRTKN